MVYGAVIGGGISQAIRNENLDGRDLVHYRTIYATAEARDGRIVADTTPIDEGQRHESYNTILRPSDVAWHSARTFEERFRQSDWNHLRLTTAVEQPDDHAQRRQTAD